MARKDPLDLSHIDPPVWRILVHEVEYGPYTLGQMRGFAAERRLTLDSLVAEGEGGAFRRADDHLPLARVLADLPTPGADGAADGEMAEARANHVLILRAAAGDSRQAVIGLLNTLGRFTEVMPGVFLLRTDTPTARLREKVEAVCVEGDRALIVNAQSGRLAWLGLGPELDAHIRAVWKKD